MALMLAMLTLTLAAAGEFDLAHYVDKLYSPITYIATFVRISKTPRFHGFLKLDFRIHIIPNPTLAVDKQTLSQDGHDETTVTAFIREAYTSYAVGSAAAEEFITTLARSAVQRLREDDTLELSGPYCECLLIEYHRNNPDTLTHPRSRSPATLNAVYSLMRTMIMQTASIT